MNPIVRIPKTISRPPDLSAPSFLHLFPEIRNAFYEVLFRRTRPILVHNVDSFHAVEPSRAKFRDFVEYHRVLTESDRLFEEEITASQDFKYDFNQFLSLLLSCRQVYYEAAGILYGCNSFVSTRVGDRCDYSDSDYHVWEEMEYCHMYYAHNWLNGLGAQHEFLARVNIDIDTLCPSHCDTRLEHYDLLPLLSLYWHHSPSQCSITFISTGRQISAHPRDTGDETEHNNVALVLNNIFSALANEDALRIKRYAPFRRILSRVNIETTLDYGSVGNGWDWSAGGRYFEISDDGRLLKWEEEGDRQLNLSGLPKHILEKIYSYIIPKPAAIVLDVDNRSTSGCPVSPLQLSRSTRNNGRLTWALTQDIPVTIVATSRSPQTDFLNLVNLEDLQSSPYGHALGFSSRNENWGMSALQKNDASHKLTLALNIRPDSPTLLSHVSIDMKRLLYLVMSHEVPPHTTIRIHMASPTSNGRSYEESSEVQFGPLRRQLFLLLSDVLDAWESYAPRSTSDGGILPKVIMNGQCELVSASYSEYPARPHTTVTNRHQHLSKSEIVRRGYRMAAGFCQYDHMYPGPAVASDSIYGLWHSLLYMGWADWE